MSNPVRELTDEDIRQMAREAEIENLLLPPRERLARGTYYRRAAIRLGVLPLADTTAEELAWFLALRVATVGGV